MAFFTTEVEGWEPVTGDWDITGCWAVDFVEMTSSTLGGLSADCDNIDNIVTSQIQLLYAPAVINETRNWITLGSEQNPGTSTCVAALEPWDQYMCGRIGTLGPVHVWEDWSPGTSTCVAGLEPWDQYMCGRIGRIGTLGQVHVWQDWKDWNPGTSTCMAGLEPWDQYMCGRIATLGPVHVWQDWNPETSTCVASLEPWDQ